MKSLHIKNLSFSYNSNPVLDNITLDVRPGEFVGLVGPNGSGKTTLLKIISKVLDIEKGSIHYGKKDIKEFNSMELAREIAVVPQGGSVDFMFSVHEVILMGRHPHQSRFTFETKKDREIVQEAMELTGIKAFSDKSVMKLSGGEFQRVLIARALSQQPNLLLLDEPTAHLDISHQLEIMDIMARLNQDRKMTILGVFHDLNLAARYCRRILLMHRGRLVADGPLEKVLTQANIRRVFNINAVVRRNPVTNNLFVDPITTVGTSPNMDDLPVKDTKDEISDRRTSPESKLRTIHVVCGAGTGSDLMTSLVEDGFEVSTGVLNVLDQDHRTASQVNIPVVREAAFSPISEKSHQANLEMISAADIIILTDVPFGIANELNLKAVESAVDHKKQVFLYEPRKKNSIETRDFTGGSASGIYKRIANKSKRVRTYKELIYEIETGKK